MIDENKTLDQQVCQRDNNYTALEERYLATTKSELVCDPYTSIQHDLARLNMTVSIIIPAYNSRSTLEQCLLAIAHSSFQQKYPSQLEVIIIDDGSTDGTWEHLQHLRPTVRLKAARIEHSGAAGARNTGIALSEGQLIICCDADMLLSVFTIEELAKRHQLLEPILLIGVRSDIEPTHPAIQREQLPTSLPFLLPPFATDVRFQAQPVNRLLVTDHLKRLGKGKKVFEPGKYGYDVFDFVWTHILSLPRSTFITVGGFNESFRGWGYEDQFLGVEAAALGHYIVPVYSAYGWHIRHISPTADKQNEGFASRKLYKSLRQEVLHSKKWSQVREVSLRRIQHNMEYDYTPEAKPVIASAYYVPYEQVLVDASRRGIYYRSLGRYHEASVAFAQAMSDHHQPHFPWLLFQQGQALRLDGQHESAIHILQEACRYLPTSASPLIELAQAQAASGQFTSAHTLFQRARRIEPANPLLVPFLHVNAEDYIQQAIAYRAQSDSNLAREAYAMALILEPSNSHAQKEWYAIS